MQAPKVAAVACSATVALAVLYDAYQRRRTAGLVNTLTCAALALKYRWKRCVGAMRSAAWPVPSRCGSSG